MKEYKIGQGELHQWVRDLWLDAGSNEREACLTADHLVEANRAGHDSHGIGMIPRYVQSWLADELQLNRRISIVHDHGNILSVDGNRGMGQAVAEEAMNLGIQRARSEGTCVIGLCHSHHLGRVGHWAEQVCAAGLVSLHFVNVLSKAVVAPFGGKDARYGTNPFTIGLPIPGAQPIVLDFATSAIALGKVRVAKNKGADVPEKCLLDANGEPTVDPGVMFPSAGDAPGALRAFGDHKGFALAVMCELLAGGLTGGATIRPETLRHRYAIWNNMLTVIFDPNLLNVGAAFAQEVNSFIEWVRSSRRTNNEQSILMPGDLEQATRRERTGSITIDADTLRDLDAAARSVQTTMGASPGPLSDLAQHITQART